MESDFFVVFCRMQAVLAGTNTVLHISTCTKFTAIVNIINVKTFTPSVQCGASRLGGPENIRHKPANQL